MTRTILAGPPIDLDALEDAAEVLEGGGLLGIPTDTVYGLGVLAEDANAVRKLFSVKQRSSENAVPLLVDSLETARQVARFTPTSERLAARHWPGPLTIVLDRREGFAAELGGNPETVGIRIPDAEIVVSLARRCGPLAVTSANRSGESEVLGANEAAQLFGDDVELFLVGSAPASGSASTVVDARAGVTVLRAGTIDLHLSDLGMS